jgi:ribosome-binding protein aMBF1 (putative translation factor)
MTTNGRCDLCGRHTCVTRYLDLFGEPVTVCQDCENETNEELILDNTNRDAETLLLL